MSTSYFKNFPTISYGDALVTNIIARAKLDSTVRNKASVFFPYTVRDGERPDIIAGNYYEDPNFAWLIYLANEMLDPYFEWPLTSLEFEQFIKRKYGSIALAQATIVFYRNNWSIDDTIINTGAYQSLPSSLKKFWTPIYDFRNNITSYERAKLDTVVETNKVVQVTHSGASDVFDYGEVVKQGTNSGVVSGVLSNSFLIEKVEGEFTTGTVTNFDGSATTTATAVATINQSIPTAQVVYYSPVYAYDYEEEINEQRKEIYILDRAYLNQIELEMKTLLR